MLKITQPSATEVCSNLLGLVWLTALVLMLMPRIIQPCATEICSSLLGLVCLPVRGAHADAEDHTAVRHRDMQQSSGASFWLTVLSAHAEHGLQGG